MHWTRKFLLLLVVSSNLQTEAQLTCPAKEFKVDFFANEELQIDGLVGSRCVKDLNFNWGASAPAELLKTKQTDRFSLRATAIIPFEEGRCVFSVSYDDGARVKLDGTTVLDRWGRCCKDAKSPLTQVTKGDHTVIGEFHEHGGLARAALKWHCIAQSTVVQAKALACPKEDFKVEVFARENLADESLVAAHCAKNVDYNWRKDAPAELMAIGQTDFFSIRATATVDIAPADGASRCFFAVNYDDGARVKVNGKEVISRWQGKCCGQSFSPPVLLAAGSSNAVVAEFREHSGAARAMLNRVCVSETVIQTAAALRCEAEQFKISFFAGEELLEDSLVGARCAADVGFDWHKEAPPELKGRSDQFSLRAEGSISFREEWCYFKVKFDDGARLKVDGRRVIDEWSVGQREFTSDAVQMSPGPHTITADFHEHHGLARAMLSWTCKTPKEYKKSQREGNNGGGNVFGAVFLGLIFLASGCLCGYCIGRRFPKKKQQNSTFSASGVLGHGAGNPNAASQGVVFGMPVQGASVVTAPTVDKAGNSVEPLEGPV